MRQYKRRNVWMIASLGDDGPTRTTGPPMASIAAFVYFWSSAYEVSGCCGTDTLYPSFLSMLATASQPEPSANAPCTRTTFLMFCVMIVLLSSLGFSESWIKPRTRIGNYRERRRQY